MKRNPNLSAIPPEYEPETRLLSGKPGILKGEFFRSKPAFADCEKDSIRKLFSSTCR